MSATPDDNVSGTEFAFIPVETLQDRIASRINDMGVQVSGDMLRLQVYLEFLIGDQYEQAEREFLARLDQLLDSVQEQIDEVAEAQRKALFRSKLLG